MRALLIPLGIIPVDSHSHTHTTQATGAQVDTRIKRQIQVSSYYCMCPHTSVYLCVLILLYLSVATDICVLRAEPQSSPRHRILRLCSYTHVRPISFYSPPTSSPLQGPRMQNDEQEASSADSQVLFDACAAAEEVHAEGLCSPFTEKDPLLEELPPLPHAHAVDPQHARCSLALLVQTYLLYWYKRTCLLVQTHAHAGDPQHARCSLALQTYLLTGTQAQILTPEERQQSAADTLRINARCQDFCRWSCC
jgi:hypothetical protein